MKMDFLVGEVISIDVFKTLSSGAVIPTLKIRSFLDGTDVDVSWLPAGPDQTMPMIGQEVLYYTIGGRNYRLVCIHGKNPAYIRKGSFGLNEGEFVVQSDSGLGYLKGSQDGSIEMASGDAITNLLLSDQGFEASAPAFHLNGFGGCTLEILEDSTILLERRSKDDNILSKIEMDSKDNLNIEVKGDVNIKAQSIRLDGKVVYGPGATDQTQSALFGDVVTAGPGGTHPFDFMTGAPIMGSSTVKAAR